MEHDTGSELDPAAASSLPDQQAPPQSSEQSEPAEPGEAASGESEDEPARESPGELAAKRELAATGEPRVDAALRKLGELDELPVSEHPGVYERVHEQLVEVLGELHSGGQSR